MSDTTDAAKPTVVWITSGRVTTADMRFYDAEEYRRCVGRWCHSVTAHEGDEDGCEVHHFISPDYGEAAEFAIALARKHRCVLRDHSQVEP